MAMWYFMLATTEENDPGWVTQAILDFFMWLLCWIVEKFLPLVEWLIGLIPAGWVPSLDGAAWFLVRVNAWIALDWGVGLAMLWVVFITAFILVKMVLKLIPTIG